jgi:hypothetical protein
MRLLAQTLCPQGQALPSLVSPCWLVPLEVASVLCPQGQSLSLAPGGSKSITVHEAYASTKTWKLRRQFALDYTRP